MRHVFVNKVKRTSHFHEFFEYIFVPMLQSRTEDHVKSNCSRDMFL